jgi:hypothetical protein
VAQHSIATNNGAAVIAARIAAKRNNQESDRLSSDHSLSHLPTCLQQTHNIGARTNDVRRTHLAQLINNF